MLQIFMPMIFTDFSWSFFFCTNYMAVPITLGKYKCWKRPFFNKKKRGGGHTGGKCVLGWTLCNMLFRQLLWAPKCIVCTASLWCVFFRKLVQASRCTAHVVPTPQTVSLASRESARWWWAAWRRSSSSCSRLVLLQVNLMHGHEEERIASCAEPAWKCSTCMECSGQKLFPVVACRLSNQIGQELSLRVKNTEFTCHRFC